MVRTSGFHPENRGSIPLGTTIVMTEQSKKWVFVYNKESGAFNTTLSRINKYIPVIKKYDCRLFKIINGLTSVKDSFLKELKNANINAVFLNKDEFKKKYDVKKPKFPAVFINEGSKIKQIISAAQIKNCNNYQDLITLIHDHKKS